MKDCGVLLARTILKKVSLIPFPAFRSGFLYIGQVMNEKKI